jgi:parallel beta-helix repeat protein
VCDTAIFLWAGWITGAEIANCGCGSSVGPRPGYVSGNIWVRQGWGNSIQSVDSHHSCNRGVWAETVKLIVWDGTFHDNEADGLDFDAGTSKSVAYGNVCNNNKRHGVFLEEGASFNTIVNNTCLYNGGAGISEGSAAAGPTTDNVALANILHAEDQDGGFALDVGGGAWARRTNDFVAVG